MSFLTTLSCAHLHVCTIHISLLAQTNVFIRTEYFRLSSPSSRMCGGRRAGGPASGIADHPPKTKRFCSRTSLKPCPIRIAQLTVTPYAVCHSSDLNRSGTHSSKHTQFSQIFLMKYPTSPITQRTTHYFINLAFRTGRLLTLSFKDFYTALLELRSRRFSGRFRRFCGH